MQVALAQESSTVTGGSSTDAPVTITVTCDDLQLITYSVMTTWNYMYPSCVKEDDQYKEQCHWMKSVVASSQTWMSSLGCQVSRPLVGTRSV
jgi:hypothetical protein